MKPAGYDQGKPFWSWLYEYEFDGATYGFPIKAASRDEAEQRLKKIAMARFIGQADGAPMSLASAPIGVLQVWWRNWQRGKQ